MVESGYYKTGDKAIPLDDKPVDAYEDLFDTEVNKYYFKTEQAKNLHDHTNPNVHMGSRNVVATVPFDITEEKKVSLYSNV